jgi:hypothetical protein
MLLDWQTNSVYQIAVICLGYLSDRPRPITHELFLGPMDSAQTQMNAILCLCTPHCHIWEQTMAL